MLSSLQHTFKVGIIPRLQLEEKEIESGLPKATQRAHGGGEIQTEDFHSDSHLILLATTYCSAFVHLGLV